MMKDRRHGHGVGRGRFAQGQTGYGLDRDGAWSHGVFGLVVCRVSRTQRKAQNKALTTPPAKALTTHTAKALTTEQAKAPTPAAKALTTDQVKAQPLTTKVTTAEVSTPRAASPPTVQQPVPSKTPPAQPVTTPHGTRPPAKVKSVVRIPSAQPPAVAPQVKKRKAPQPVDLTTEQFKHIQEQDTQQLRRTFAQLTSLRDTVRHLEDLYHRGVVEVSNLLVGNNGLRGTIHNNQAQAQAQAFRVKGEIATLRRLYQDEPQRPRGPDPKPATPPFYHGAHKGSEAETWLFQLDNYFRLLAQRYPEQLADDYKISYAVSLLRDTAAQWWMLRTKANSGEQAIHSFEGFKAALTKKFVPVNAKEQAREKLAYLTQTGALEVYVEQFENLSLQIDDLSAAEGMDKFCRGLKPEHQI
eukprot:gene31109-6240_t